MMQILMKTHHTLYHGAGYDRKDQLLQRMELLSDVALYRFQFILDVIPKHTEKMFSRLR